MRKVTALLMGLFGLVLITSTLVPNAAEAGWRRWGWGWGPGVYVAPGYGYYAYPYRYYSYGYYPYAYYPYWRVPHRWRRHYGWY